MTEQNASRETDANFEAPTGVRPLTVLQPGQIVIVGGDRYLTVDDELAARFQPGDHVVADPTSGQLLHIPASENALARDAMDRAVAAFGQLADCTDEQITDFFHRFADRLEETSVAAELRQANEADVERAVSRGRSTTRLVLTESMLAAMIAGLRGWAETAARRDVVASTTPHEDWTVEARRAPLGVVGFIFEGRPNVFADAVGVIRTGNTVVFRIGSDALGTAQAMMRLAVEPSLSEAGLPTGTVVLIESAAHAAGWALFAEPRLSLAVARGSGPAVSQLGAVARQAGIPVSLHGTGGAWVIAAADAPPTRLRDVLINSLDRKVCNTANTICIPAEVADTLIPVVLDAVRDAARRRDPEIGGRVHFTAAASPFVGDAVNEPSIVGRADGHHQEMFATPIDVGQLGHEWEWEASPEVTLHVVADVDEAVQLFNRYSPRFVASVISEDTAVIESCYAKLDAPFVGDGFTRWVDGQYALDAPELGLSNWENGRLLGRGGILSGDSMFTIRYRALTPDAGQHR